MSFGRDYILPTPFDSRLLEVLPVEIARAAMEDGVARKFIHDFEKYRDELK